MVAFYNAADQELYKKYQYLPQEEYRLGLNLPKDAPAPVTNQGIVNTNAFTGGGNNNVSYYQGPYSSLFSDYQKAVDDRQARLTELNRPLDPGTFNVASNLTGRGRLDPMGSGYYEALNRLEAKDPSGYRMSTFNESFAPSGEVVQSIDYNPKTNTNIKKAFWESVYQDPKDNLPRYYDAEEPTLNRKIQDALYSRPGLDKPQSAEMIMEEGYTGTSGAPGILGAVLGRVDRFGNLPRADQAFISSQMGYTGPTVFGENPTGLSKDPFGINVRSATGNYAEYVGDKYESLLESLGAAGAIGGKKDFEGAVFDEETNSFKLADGSTLSKAELDALNKRTDLVRKKLNFYRQKTQERDDFRAQEAQKIQDEIKAAAATKDRDAALAAIKRQGEANYTPSIHGAIDYGKDSQGKQSFDFGMGFGIGSDGGPVSNKTGKGRTGFMMGGLASIL